MPCGYHPLTYAERCQIHALKKSGLSIRGIAHQLERSPGTISREIVRNRGGRGYRHRQAQDRVLTLTADNGKEFAGHRAVSAALAADFYLATPYHSWERGLNEHTHGLVRQYLPKGTDFRTVTGAQVQVIEDRINHRPRKVLGYRTPAEVFTGVPGPP